MGKNWDISDETKEKDIPERAKLKKAQETDFPSAEIIADTGRLFVKNLAYTCTQEELQNLFGAFGPLSEVGFYI
jgi:multiple RNA-binding domain-containing protein 1